jgi:hypothetical protein
MKRHWCSMGSGASRTIYTMSFGLQTALRTTGGALVGAHGSILSFRFGAKREFLLNIQEGAWFGDSQIILEQSIGLSYMFL